MLWSRSKDTQPVSPNGRKSGLWLDAPNAITQLNDRGRNDMLLQKVGRELIEVGFSVIPGLQDPGLCDQARRDYYDYIREHSDDAAKHRDEVGRQYRLTNFHVASEAAMKIAKNPEIMRVLDFLVDREAAVHTSLTFQYSTMQALHRDSPYFHTFPESLFFGVWTALEDIDADSGPLSYVPGSHRIKIDQWALYNEALAKARKPDAARLAALQSYQSKIITMANRFAPRAYSVLRKGDVAIWHPQLIHGGSPAKRPELTRHSMVVHCCPADTHVYIDDAFFQHQKDTPPRPYYSFVESMGRKHGDFRVPGFMDSI
jgi:phytanoyl-CoA hydroxylase